MPSIAAQDFCAAVYCAHAPHDALPAMTQPRIAFLAESTAEGEKDLLEILFEGVRSLRWTPALAAGQLPYSGADRLELSEVELDGRPGEWRVRLNLWYRHDVEFVCGGIMLNHADVAGEGHFVQDWIPASRPLVPRYGPSAA